MVAKSKVNNLDSRKNEELIVISSNMLPSALKEMGIDSILLDKNAYFNGLLQADIEKIKAAVSSLAAL